ncbi:MAG: peptidylprolyl isomerase [Planctomycetes bacterium]|nr:peptidylprolyl isomerase [Planctomycetota bacterium]
METTQGEMILEFYPEAAFNHVMHFVDRVQTGGYDGLLFHRVISGFMIQGGDPLGTGYGGPGYMIPQEFNNTPHEPGVLSMARSNDVNSAGCQFFICHKKKEILDGQYTAFGKVIEGLDVVNKIAATRVDEGDRPIEDQKMISLKIETREAK